MAYPASVTNEVDPISRIEGHLGIAVNVSGLKVSDAYAHGNLWRGFENFLLGRTANDAITFTQRICGVCPVPHGMTSTYAVDTVLGYSQGHITFAGDDVVGLGVPKNAVHIRNLVLGMEFLMSSITHFYHLVAPSYIQGPAIPPWTPYFASSYYNTAMLNTGPWAYPQITPNGTAGAGFSKDLWSTVIRSYVVALRIRRLTFEAGALFAGRMPMTSVYIGGGVTYDKGEIGTTDFVARCNMFKTIAQEVGEFIVQEYVPIALALGVLYPNYDNLTMATALDTYYSSTWHAGNQWSPSSDAPSSANTGWGAGLKRFLAWGAFPDGNDTGASAALTLPGGVKFTPADITGGKANFKASKKNEIWATFINPAATATNVPTNLTEDITHSRYQVASADITAYGGALSGTVAYPGNVSRTRPSRNKATAYTYMKAPRWNGLPCEVGPMARLYVADYFTAGTQLATSLASVGYTAYVKPVATPAVGSLYNPSNYGLDPKMIKADIAVALLHAGLANLSSASAGTVLFPAGGTLPTAASATINAYADSDTVITGAIADWVVLMTAGYSTMDRLRARALESLVLIQAILGAYDPSGVGASWNGTTGNHTGTWAGNGWLNSLANASAGSLTWKNKGIPAGVAQGWGATEAPRGALMHQCTISAGKITKYQCIVPTTWNGSPTDGSNQHGAIEAAVIGTPFAAADCTFTSQDGSTTKHSVGGVEVLRVAQSFDPCIACAVH